MATITDSAGQIVVGTDGSQRAHKAVEWAAERAVARGLPLRIIYAVPDLPLPGHARALTSVYQDAHHLAKSLDRVQHKLDEAIELVHAEFPDAQVIGQVVQGNPSYLLAEASKDAALVVVGARGEGAPISVRLLGGVSDAVMQHAKGPVAVIGDETYEYLDGPVVVGVDESDEAKAAVAFAFDEAEARGVPLVALHTWDFGAYDAALWEKSDAKISEDFEHMVKEMLADEISKHPDVPVRVKASRGRPEPALVEESKTAGLTVVGSRGRGGFTGLLLGSTSKHVLREAHSPVVVTRG